MSDAREPGGLDGEIVDAPWCAGRCPVLLDQLEQPATDTGIVRPIAGAAHVRRTIRRTDRDQHPFIVPPTSDTADDQSTRRSAIGAAVSP